MKLRDLDDFKKAINVAVLAAFAVTFSLMVLALVFAYKHLEDRNRNLYASYMGSAAAYFQSELADQLRSIANSEIFVDYLHSDEYSRTRLMSEFLVQIGMLDNDAVKGLEVIDASDNAVFAYGIKTDFKVVLKLAYCDRVLDDAYGTDVYYLALYFSRQSIGEALMRINPVVNVLDINNKAYASAPKVQIWRGDKFDTFTMESFTPLELAFEWPSTSHMIAIVTIMLTMLVLMTLFIRLYISVLMHKYVAHPFKNLTLAIQNDQNLSAADYTLDEFKYLVAHINLWKQQIDKIQQERRDAEVGRLMTQVVHDIRSPLVALDVAAKNLSHVSDEQRIIIRNAVQRINDIANYLLQKHRRDPHENAALTAELAEGIADLIISEKRIQYAFQNINIQVECDDAAHGAFVYVQPVEMKRLLSNVFNNAIESLGQKGGSISVKMSADAQRWFLRIVDNGCGIAPEHMDKLFQKGVSFKSGGTGLGLYHAQQFLNAWRGDINIKSEVGVGTKVTITLPRCEIADWFCGRIAIGHGWPVVVVDDDTSVHDFWRTKLAQHCQVRFFANDTAFLTWAQDRSLVDGVPLFLVDYELSGCQKTGLDLIEGCGLTRRAVLVTSHFEDLDIRKRCTTLGVKILPKNFAASVELDWIREDLDLILIDDDSNLLAAWQLHARASGKHLETFVSSDAFLRVCSYYSKDTPVYIDVDLGDGKRGESVAVKLHEAGFTQLYLATGFDSEQINVSQMPWLKAVVGKEPPWHA